MKTFVLLCAFVALASCAPQQKDNSKDAYIVKYDSDNIGIDGYNYAVETSDGQTREEQGELTNAGTDDEAMVVRGRYGYIGTDGVEYTVTYVAGPQGFQAEGAHIPKTA